MNWQSLRNRIIIKRTYDNAMAEASILGLGYTSSVSGGEVDNGRQLDNLPSLWQAI